MGRVTKRTRQLKRAREAKRQRQIERETEAQSVSAREEQGGYQDGQPSVERTNPADIAAAPEEAHRETFGDLDGSGTGIDANNERGHEFANKQAEVARPENALQFLMRRTRPPFDGQETTFKYQRGPAISRRQQQRKNKDVEELANAAKGCRTILAASSTTPWSPGGPMKAEERNL